MIQSSPTAISQRQHLPLLFKNRKPGSGEEERDARTVVREPCCCDHRRVKKTSVGDSSLGLSRTSKGDGLDLLVDAIENLLRRSHESTIAFQKAQESALKLHITSEKGEERNALRSIFF